MARDPGIGDYVLATKYSDGDPCDHFCVGIVSGRIPHDRYLVADNDGKQQRANGFRRAERITAEEGRQLVELMPEIGDVPGPSLWWHLATIRGETKEGDERTPDLEIVSALNEQVATLEEQNAALLAACKRFEWGGQAYPMDESYQGCANSACPACGGINPNERHMGADSIGVILYDWDDEKYGHADDCVLKAAIEAAEKGEDNVQCETEARNCKSDSSGLAGNESP